jgi:hypothetical protein
LVKKDKGNHDGKSDLASNGELVLALAMQNNNNAHKLIFKATKKQQKMLRQLDAHSDGQANHKKNKEANSSKDSKSNSKKGQKDSVKKGKCSKLGKWGSHTAEKCTSDESQKKNKEANMASTENSGSPG